MKNLITFGMLFVTLITFSQETKKDKELKPGMVDKTISASMDSLSKKYNKKVVSYMIVTTKSGDEKYITYVSKGKLITEQIN